MAIYKKENTTFLLDVYKKSELLSCLYTQLDYTIEHNKGHIQISKTNDVLCKSRLKGNHIYSQPYIPEYIWSTLQPRETFGAKSFNSVKGYGVWLGKYNSISEYLSELQRNHRKSLSKSVRRLEQCFDVSYKMYHGDISESTYTELMDRLKSMILKRFEQRGEISESITLWDKIYGTSLDLIREGKASLSVGYDGDLPINISLNYHYDKILFGYVSSYDIDYAKFSLGQISIYKRIEWCLENGYLYFDMGWGDLSYKKVWSNYIYTFKHQILYPKNKPLVLLQVYLLGWKTELFAYLISKKVNIYFRRLKSLFKKEEANNNIIMYALEDIEPNHLELKNLKQLDLNSAEVPKSILYDFLFFSQDKLSNISLYAYPDSKSYVVKGNKLAKKIVIQ